MSTLIKDLFCRGDGLNAMTSTVEGDREDLFSLLENSDENVLLLNCHPVRFFQEAYLMLPYKTHIYDSKDA